MRTSFVAVTLNVVTPSQNAFRLFLVVAGNCLCSSHLSGRFWCFVTSRPHEVALFLASSDSAIMDWFDS